MSLAEVFKEKASDVLSDTSHEGEIKRLRIPLYLSGILLTVMGANYVFSFKAELIDIIPTVYYSNFLTIIKIIFDILLFIFVSASMLAIISLILHGLLVLLSPKISLLEKPASVLKNLYQGADYRTDNTSTWLLLFFLLMAATQPGKILADINQILLFFNPIRYLAYFAIMPAIIYTYSNILSLIGRFISRPTNIFTDNKEK